MSKSTRKVIADFRETAEVMRALGHSERLAIAWLLFRNSNGGLTVKSIYEQLNLAQPIVSKHLAIMKAVGAVRKKREGQYTYYYLCRENKNIDYLSGCFC